MSLGAPEMIVIVILVLVLFGPDKLPDLARGLGRGIREFRKITSEFQNHLDVMSVEEKPKRAASPSQADAHETSEHETSQYDTMHLPNVHGTRDRVDSDASHSDASRNNETHLNAPTTNGMNENATHESATRPNATHDIDSHDGAHSSPPPITSAASETSPAQVESNPVEAHGLNFDALRNPPKTRAPLPFQEPTDDDHHTVHSTP